jgi:hypothetical protein
MPESIQTRIKRWIYNFYPVYRRTGARIIYIDDSWQKIRISIPLRIWTRNYYGTISGISMFGGVDPIYMVMLIKLLGPDYVVWDKEAAIRFIKPGRNKLVAEFKINDDELNHIRQTLEAGLSVTRTYHVDLVDAQGTVCASVDKVIHIKKRNTQKDEG